MTNRLEWARELSEAWLPGTLCICILPIDDRTHTISIGKWQRCCIEGWFGQLVRTYWSGTSTLGSSALMEV